MRAEAIDEGLIRLNLRLCGARFRQQLLRLRNRCVALVPTVLHQIFEDVWSPSSLQLVLGRQAVGQHHDALVCRKDLPDVPRDIAFGVCKHNKPKGG